MTAPPSSQSKLPKSLGSNPRLGQWLKFTANRTVDVWVGKVELGQGITTALLQIASEALELKPDRIRMIRPSTACSPNEGVTSSSLSIQDCGRSLHHVCCEVRELFRKEAADQLGVDPDALVLDDGTFIGPGNTRTSYWELAQAVSLDRPATLHEWGQIHRSVVELARIDIPGKAFGQPSFIHDLRMAGMLHGRVLHPARLGSRRSDNENLQAVAGADIKVVESGAFVGLLGDDERQVELAAETLRKRIAWQGGEALPDEANLSDWMRTRPVDTAVETRELEQPALPTVRTISRSFLKPYIAHASMAPSCALACWMPGDSAIKLRVWTHSQGIYNLQADLAVVFGLPPAAIVVEHVEGAGCYGHNPADDVALDAALLARSCPGRPVRVLWSREQELSCGPFGPAMQVDLEIGLSADNDIASWRHTIWSSGHSMRPGRSGKPTLRAAAEIEGGEPCPIAINLPQSAGGGSDRNAMPPYLVRTQIINNRLLSMPLRTSSLRALGAYANVVAIEGMMDEIARLREEDPIAFRLKYLDDPRARRVIETAARLAPAPGKKRGDGFGRGFAFSRYKNNAAYCAVVADVVCEDEVRVERLFVTVDVGEVINRDGVINQIEGGAIQATSWALKEAVRFDTEAVLSCGWESYPILRFTEVPSVDVHIVETPGVTPLGSGEASQGPTGAAIANAVFDATGIRVNRFPLTRDNLIAAMEI